LALPIQPALNGPLRTPPVLGNGADDPFLAVFQPRSRSKPLKSGKLSSRERSGPAGPAGKTR